MSVIRLWVTYRLTLEVKDYHLGEKILVLSALIVCRDRGALRRADALPATYLRLQKKK